MRSNVRQMSEIHHPAVITPKRDRRSYASKQRSDGRPPAVSGESPCVICGVRIDEIEDPLMRNIRYLDKLVDELAKGSRWKRSCESSVGESLPHSLDGDHRDNRAFQCLL